MKARWITAIAFLVLSAHLAHAANAPQFGDYPASIYAGPTSAPDLSSHPDARTYRTRLRNAAQGPVNFAGEYVLATWGCGTTCLMGAAINARTGQVSFMPHTVCCWNVDNANPIDSRADSNLIVFTGLLNEEEPEAVHYFVFAGGQFHFIQREAAVASLPPPVPSGVRTLSSRDRVPSSGADRDVTDFTLINDLNFDFTVKWLDARAIDNASTGGDQTDAHPFVSPGQAWRVERGARTWESHWYSVVTRNGLVCSFSPRQGETVRISQLPDCDAATPANDPQTVAPTCPAGYVLSGGRCERDTAPTPTCPAGYEFSQGQCMRAAGANPPSGANMQQCAAACDRLGERCNDELTSLGDAQGWDGDLRQDYWDDTCVPRVNACKFACNPPGPMGPADCRFTRDGNQICS